MKLSVVICSYAPKLHIFLQVLEALKQQSLSHDEWELILIDNNSPTPVAGLIDLGWHENSKIICEPIPGLAHARMAGVVAAQTPLIVFVDDDNLLNETYLETALRFHNEHPEVGCFGGRSLPVYETKPPGWFFQTGIDLGCQDYGSEEYISNFNSDSPLKGYPEKAPIGTGMVISRKAFLYYQKEAAANPERLNLGRRGTSLSSGEDNDIILTLVKAGYQIAYVPRLVVNHLIPSSRFSFDYLKRMAFESNRTWVKVLEVHGINPHQKIPKWTIVPRMIKSYLTLKAWKSDLHQIRWKSSCGLFHGLSEI